MQECYLDLYNPAIEVHIISMAANLPWSETVYPHQICLWCLISWNNLSSSNILVISNNFHFIKYSMSLSKKKNCLLLFVRVSIWQSLFPHSLLYIFHHSLTSSTKSMTNKVIFIFPSSTGWSTSPLLMKLCQLCCIKLQVIISFVNTNHILHAHRLINLQLSYQLSQG